MKYTIRSDHDALASVRATLERALAELDNYMQSAIENEPEAETLKQVLMRRDGLTSKEADEQIEAARALVRSGADPEDVLLEEFGLESDYFFDLL